MRGVSQKGTTPRAIIFLFVTSALVAIQPQVPTQIEATAA